MIIDGEKRKEIFQNFVTHFVFSHLTKKKISEISLTFMDRLNNFLMQKFYLIFLYHSLILKDFLNFILCKFFDAI